MMTEKKSRTLPTLENLQVSCEIISEKVGQIFSWLVWITTFTTFFIVLLRYGFRIGWVSMQELVSDMHALTLVAASGYALKQGDHVRVDIFYRQCSTKTQNLINLFGALFLLFPVSLFILISSWNYVMNSWNIHETSADAGGLPIVFLVKSLLILLPILLMIQGVAEIIKVTQQSSLSQ